MLRRRAVARLSPRVVANGIGFGLILWALLVWGARSLFAQVATTLHVRQGHITSSIIRNTSGTDTMTVTVELLDRRVVGSTVQTGRVIAARISPARFTLEPGATQTVRIRLQEPIPPKRVLAYVVTFTPIVPFKRPGTETTAVARLILATRFVAKAVVE